MTRKSIGPALLLAAAFAVSPAHAGIEKLESCGLTWGGGVVGLGRGRFNDVTVTGFGVDLATSVDTTAAGTTLSVHSRKNGFGSNIVIRLVPAAVGDRIVGAQVTLHYFGGGTDVFNVDVSAGPSVTSIAFVPGGGVSTSGGTTRVTSLDPHVVVLKGKNLDALQVDEDDFQRGGLREAHAVLQVSGELRVSFKSDAGERSINSTLFRIPAGACGQTPPDFTLGFTVFDPPRTPTPTPTATPTITPPFHPITFTPGVRTSFGPTPTPKNTPTPLFSKGGK
jgi:hypothetical protein